MIPLVLGLMAAGGFYVATLLLETPLGASRVVHRLAMVVAAGILLGVAIADLIPEAFEHGDGMIAPLSIAGGFLLLYAVETLTGGHTHHHEPHMGGHEHAHGHSHAPVTTLAAAGAEPEDGCVPAHPVLPFLIGLGLHNAADGVVIGAGHAASDSAATGVAIGILLHQLPVGLSFGAVLLASGMGRRRARRFSMLIAAMIPLGALTVLAIPGASGHALAAMIGGAAGALLYIATGHLLPEAHSEHRHKDVAIAFAVSLIGTVALVAALHDTAHAEAEGGHVEAASSEQGAPPYSGPRSIVLVSMR